MAFYDERLKALHTQKLQKKRLEAMKLELIQQVSVVSLQVEELEKIKIKEQIDVDKLEGKSLKAFLYQVAGNKEEKLSKERKEAYAATMKYDAAMREKERIETDFNDCIGELSKLMECESEYESLLEEKKEAIKASGSIGADKVLQKEEKIADLEHEIRELGEALAVGKQALTLADEIVYELSEANSLADWDMFMDSMFVDIQKQEHIHTAQAKVEILQNQLRCFKTELADVNIQGDIVIELDSFSEFADWFFDNIFTDWDIKDRIENSLNQATDTKNQIENTINKLDRMLEQRQQEKQDSQEQLEKMVVELIY